MPEADPYMTLSADSNIKVKGEGRERKQTLWVLAQDDRPFVPSPDNILQLLDNASGRKKFE